MEVKKVLKYNRQEKCDICQRDYAEFYIETPFSPTGEYPQNEIHMYYLGKTAVCEPCLEKIVFDNLSEHVLYSLWSCKKESQTKKKPNYLKKSIPPKLRWQVLKRNNFTCLNCGSRGESSDDLHADHIIPEYKGGETSLNNLQTLCRKCNFSKQTKIIDYKSNNELATREVNPAKAESMD